MSLLIAAAGILVLAPSAYLLLLAVLALLPPRVQGSHARQARLAVVVPAHNESEFIGRCVRSLLAQTYPRSRFEVVVVADNCTDTTAGAARAAGATVLVRDDVSRRGKGHALSFAFDRLAGRDRPFDAYLVVDADSIADPSFIEGMAAELERGHEVVQADDRLIEDADTAPRARLEAAALLLRNHVRFAGLQRLGVSASLCGNGMLISRRVLVEHPWSAFSATEDGEYSLRLRAAGERIHYAPDAFVYAAPTAGGRGAHTQGMRWERGRARLARQWCLRLVALGVARRRPDLLGTALDLAMPPLAALSLATVVGGVTAAAAAELGWVATWAVWPWAAALVAVPAYIGLGLAGARVPLATYLAFAAAPWFVVRKLAVYVALLRGGGGEWTRTQRPSERATPAGTGV